MKFAQPLPEGPDQRPPNILPPVTFFTFLVAMFLALALFTGCSGAQRQRTNIGIQKSMNVATDIVDPGYELAVVSCDAAEGVIIRQSSTADTARPRIESVRRECDRIFQSFEAVRAAQRAAREAGDAYEEGSIAFADLLATIAAAKDLAGEVKALVTAFRSNHDLGGEE